MPQLPISEREAATKCVAMWCNIRWVQVRSRNRVRTTAHRLPAGFHSGSPGDNNTPVTLHFHKFIFPFTPYVVQSIFLNSLLVLYVYSLLNYSFRFYATFFYKKKMAFTLWNKVWIFVYRTVAVSCLYKSAGRIFFAIAHCLYAEWTDSLMVSYGKDSNIVVIWLCMYISGSKRFSTLSDT